MRKSTTKAPTNKKPKEWHKLKLKPKTSTETSTTTTIREYKMPLTEKNLNTVNITDSLYHLPTKPTVKQKKHETKKLKITRNASQRVWERKQRTTQIGKKATRRINKVSEKKYFLNNQTTS